MVKESKSKILYIISINGIAGDYFPPFQSISEACFALGLGLSYRSLAIMNQLPLQNLKVLGHTAKDLSRLKAVCKSAKASK
jgi:hypothetical protein